MPEDFANATRTIAHSATKRPFHEKRSPAQRSEPNIIRKKVSCSSGTARAV
eukprot:Skav202182  [mRNA]  locus=scaffold1204:103568:103720:- [translate_table: standard]